MTAGQAVSIINAAIRNSMFPLGVMPEADSDKIAEAEKLVVLCRQSKKLADAFGPSGPARVKNFQAITEILTEAGDTGVQPSLSPQQSSPTLAPPPVSSSPDSTTVPEASTIAEQVATPSPASSSSPSSSPAPSPDAMSVAPVPVDPDGLLSEPKLHEQWEGAGGGRWLVEADHGAMVDVVSPTSGERTVVPKGFLKTKMTEAFVAVEVDPEWHVQGARGYNTLWYTHGGCVRWYAPLDDCLLPQVGAIVQCVTCDLELPVMVVQPNGYVPRPADNAAPPEAMIGSEEAQGGGPSVPDLAPPQPKLNEIHLTAYPQQGVKVYEHPGCSSWQAPLVGKDGRANPLLEVGAAGPCPNCNDQDIPLTVVEANGYDPATYQQAPTPPVQQPVGAVFSSNQQALVDPSTLQPVVQQAPQEVASSAPSQQPAPQSSPPPSPPAPQTPSPPSAPATTTTAPLPPSASASTSGSAPPSSPSPSTARSTGAPVDHDDGDAEYARILDQAETDFLPAGMPAPQDLEEPPGGMPEDLTANPEANRLLHSQFNALAARARYLAKIDERVARDCGRAVRLRLRPHMAKAKKELGASSTLTERREWAEEIGGDDVKLWLDRQQLHADRAEAYGEFFAIYAENVRVLSRDLTWATNEERGA